MLVGCEESVVYMVGGVCAWAFVVNACAEYARCVHLFVVNRGMYM